MRTSTEIAFQQVLQNSSKTFYFYNKIKTKFNHKKFTLPLNPSRQPRFRGKVNLLWSNLVLILLWKWRFLLLFRKTCWSAISVDVLTNSVFLAEHGHKNDEIESDFLIFSIHVWKNLNVKMLIHEWKNVNDKNKFNEKQFYVWFCFDSFMFASMKCIFTTKALYWNIMFYSDEVLYFKRVLIEMKAFLIEIKALFLKEYTLFVQNSLKTTAICYQRIHLYY